MHTRVSSKGQVIIPKSVRERLGWRPGTKLAVAMGPGGVTLRALHLPRPEPAEIDRVFGCLARPGAPALTLEAMDAAVLATAARRDEAARGPSEEDTSEAEA